MISVIVPVHNDAAYLPDCVESILGQTSVEVELILVDDASADASADMCRAYAASHSQVRTVRTAGVGVSQARNIGLAMASGSYIAFADADDCYMPGALSAMLGIMESAEGCDIVVSQFARRRDDATPPRHTALLSPEEAIEATLYQRPLQHPSAWAKLYRRRIFEECPEPFVAGRRYEDLESCPRLYAAARAIAVTDARLYYYRPNMSSFINTWSPARADALWAVDSIREFVGRRYPALAAAALSRSFSAYFNVFNLASAAGRDELVGHCRRFIAAHRRAILADPCVRLKNKAGAILSYFPGLGMLSRLYQSRLCR